MGTSAAVMWETLYFGYHEKKTLIPKCGNHMLYFKRFIDAIIGIWLIDDTSAWDDFKIDVNVFGILTWEIGDLGMPVGFLDLTLAVNGEFINFCTFEKAMNLHLYLPPSSAHSHNVLKGTIYGLILRYFTQNTYRKDYTKFVVLLYKRLLARGWQRDTIYPIFVDAAMKMESKFCFWQTNKWRLKSTCHLPPLIREQPIAHYLITWWANPKAVIVCPLCLPNSLILNGVCPSLNTTLQQNITYYGTISGSTKVQSAK